MTTLREIQERVDKFTDAREKLIVLRNQAIRVAIDAGQPVAEIVDETGLMEWQVRAIAKGRRR